MFASDGFSKVTGYNKEEILGYNCRFLQGPDTDPQAVNDLRNAIANGERCSIRLLNYRKDGSQFWNYLTIAPVYNSVGSVVKYIGVQVDVTQETDGKCAVDEGGVPLLIKSDARLETKIQRPVGEVLSEIDRVKGDGADGPSGRNEDMPMSDSDNGTTLPAVPTHRKGIEMSTTMERVQQSFVISDPSLPDCPIVYASDDFLSLTGYSREEVLGRNCRFLQGEDTDSETVYAVRDAIERGTECTVRLLNYRKDGTPFWNMFSLAPVRGNDNTVQFFVGVQADVSDHGVEQNTKNTSQRTAQKVSKFVNQLTGGKKEDEFNGICVHELSWKPHRSNRKAFRAAADAQQRNSKKKLGSDDFEVVQRLGKGDVGEVMLVRLKDGNTNSHFAMKCVSKKDTLARNKVHRVRAEDAILKKIDHPLIANLIMSFQTETHLHFITEHCSGGELFQAMQKMEKRRFEEWQARFYASEVVIALQYLHLHSIVYRDLKPENILLLPNGHIALTDFDLSFVSPSPTEPQLLMPPDSQQPKQLCVKRGKDSRSHTKLLYAEPLELTNSFVGTEEYLSPEVINAAGHSAAVDWWELGILLYELMFGVTPFRGPHRDVTFSNVLHVQLRFPTVPKASQSAYDLMRGLIRKDPERRLGSNSGAEEVMAHSFFTSPQGHGGPLHWHLLDCQNHPPPFVPENNK